MTAATDPSELRQRRASARRTALFVAAVALAVYGGFFVLVSLK